MSFVSAPNADLARDGLAGAGGATQGYGRSAMLWASGLQSALVASNASFSTTPHNAQITQMQYHEILHLKQLY